VCYVCWVMCSVWYVCDMCVHVCVVCARGQVQVSVHALAMVEGAYNPHTQTHTHTHTHTHTGMDGRMLTGTHTHTHSNTKTHKHTERETDRQTQRERRTDRRMLKATHTAHAIHINKHTPLLPISFLPPNPKPKP